MRSVAGLYLKIERSKEELMLLEKDMESYINFYSRIVEEINRDLILNVRFIHHTVVHILSFICLLVEQSFSVLMLFILSFFQMQKYYDHNLLLLFDPDLKNGKQGISFSFQFFLIYQLARFINFLINC